MSKTMLDRGQLVGYDFETKNLIITVGEQLAQKLKADGWAVQHSEEVGCFVTIKMEEN